MTPDPHMADYCRQYRRTTCYRAGCNELVPLSQSPRLRGLYCLACQAIVLADADRINNNSAECGGVSDED